MFCSLAESLRRRVAKTRFSTSGSVAVAAICWFPPPNTVHGNNGETLPPSDENRYMFENTIEGENLIGSQKNSGQEQTKKHEEPSLVAQNS